MGKCNPRRAVVASFRIHDPALFFFIYDTAKQKMNLEGNDITSMSLKLRYKPQKPRYAKIQLSFFLTPCSLT